MIFVDYCRLEVEPYAVLLEDDGYSPKSGGASLDDRYWKLATGEEARFLAVHRDQVRLSEGAQRALLLQRADHCEGVAAHYKEVQ